MRLVTSLQPYSLPVSLPLFAKARRAVKKVREHVIFTRSGATSTAKRLRKRKPRRTTPKRQIKFLSNIPFSKITIFLFFLISIGILVAVLRGVPGNPTPNEIKLNLQEKSKPFELSPERGRYATIMALDERHSFSLSETLRDVVYPDVGYIDGRYYSFFAPGISLLAYPFYAVGKYFNLAQVLSFSTISLFTFLNLIVIFKISKKIFSLPTWAALFGATVFGFGSTALSYSNTLYQHQVTTFFILSSFFAVYKFSQKGKYSFIWAAFVWLNYGLAILIDYPNAILMFPIMLYLLFETVSFKKIRSKISMNLRLSSIITIVIFAVITGLHGYYNFVNFGAPQKVSGSLVGYKAVKEFKLLENEKGLEKLKELENIKQPVAFFREENLPKGLFILLFDNDKGIFFFSPIFAIALLNFFYMVPRMNRLYGVLLGLIGVNFFLYASFGDPWGGYAYGPRYLIPTMGVLSIFVAQCLTHTAKKFLLKILTFVLFIYSSGVSILGAITTNSVPPKVEAIPLKTDYNYLLNLNLMNKDISSSYIYNTYFSNIPLFHYFLFLFGIVAALAFITLFILPYLKRYDN